MASPVSVASLALTGLISGTACWPVSPGAARTVMGTHVIVTEPVLAIADPQHALIRGARIACGASQHVQAGRPRRSR